MIEMITTLNGDELSKFYKQHYMNRFGSSSFSRNFWVEILMLPLKTKMIEFLFEYGLVKDGDCEVKRSITSDVICSECGF